MPSVVASITAEDTFSAALEFHGSKQTANLSVSGTFSATVTAQRSFDNGSNWLDVEQYTSGIEKVLDNVERAVLWRVGVKTGDYSSGTVEARLSY